MPKQKALNVRHPRTPYLIAMLGAQLEMYSSYKRQRWIHKQAICKTKFIVPHRWRDAKESTTKDKDFRMENCLNEMGWR